MLLGNEINEAIPGATSRAPRVLTCKHPPSVLGFSATDVFLDSDLKKKTGGAHKFREIFGLCHANIVASFRALNGLRFSRADRDTMVAQLAAPNVASGGGRNGESRAASR